MTVGETGVHVNMADFIPVVIVMTQVIIRYFILVVIIMTQVINHYFIPM